MTTKTLSAPKNLKFKMFALAIVLLFAGVVAKAEAPESWNEKVQTFATEA
jgi:hypothetical protein